MYYWGQPAYADYSNELWVVLAEKAYAQLNESGWIGYTKDGRDIRPQDHGTNAYQGIYGGYSGTATEQITGQQMDGSWIKDTVPEKVVRAFKAGQFVSFSSNDLATRVVSNHAYALVDYNSTTQMFTFYNPWGWDGVSS